MSNDDETVERVARAIAALRLRGGGVSFDDPQVDEYFRQSIYDEARAAISAMPPRDELLREALSALEPFAKEAAEWGVNGKPLPDDFQIEVREAGYPATPALFNLGDLRRARAAADKIRAGIKEGEANG